jgi:peptidoglycan L-alanyl-D-glutamate endopeptidase CwlK
MPSRKVEDLNPKLQPLANKFLEECKKAGYPVFFTCTLRSAAEQNELYKEGRTKPGTIKTNAVAYNSWHNYGLAFDIAFQGENIYEGPWEKVGAIGRGLGLIWGGDFKSLKDKPHFEYHPGLVLKTAYLRLIKKQPLL